MSEESLFHQALSLPPNERSSYLDQVCAGQPELRAVVDELLAVHGQLGDFIARPALAVSDAPSVDNGQVDNRGSTLRETAAHDASTNRDEPSNPAVPLAMPGKIGRYQIRKLLGRGGMGAVFLAHDPQLDRLVALKVPKLLSAGAEERFLREARAAAAVSHPHLCPVYDAGRVDGVPYLAMAFINGPTLTEVLKKEGPLPLGRAAALAAGIAHGMAEAHRHGIVHRDLKPGNILLNERGQPVITDFGLALRDNAADAPVQQGETAQFDPRLTQVGFVMGTPSYMPPEQAAGELDKIGPASDVYALGAMLFEMLTGRPPLQADSVAELMQKIRHDAVPAPSRVRSGTSNRLDVICLRALAKDPAQRYPSMDSMAQALLPHATGGQNRRWWGIAVAAAAFCLMIVAGVIIYLKTNYGTIEVRLSDPNAKLEFSIDGDEVRLTEDGKLTRIGAGPHGLTVRGPGYETQTKLFAVKRGETTVVEFELKPEPGAAPKSTPSASKPDLYRLAALLRTGRELIAQGLFSELKPIVDEALAIDPASPTALAYRSTYRASKGDVAGAREDIEAALKLNPETYQALLNRGYLNSEESIKLLRGELADDAVADTTIAVRIEPKLPVAWSNRAFQYFTKGEFRQAIADATKAIELGDKRPNAHQTRGGAYAMLGEYQKALEDYKIAAARAPGLAKVHLQLASVYDRLGDPIKSNEEWQLVRRLDKSFGEGNRFRFPDPPTPMERKKLVPAESAALEQALAEFERAWRTGNGSACEKAANTAWTIDPTSAAAREARARIWAQLNRFKEALAEAEAAVRLDPTYAWAYATRGAAKNGLGKPAAAISDHNIALRIDRSNFHCWLDRARAYFNRSQYHQALDDLNVCLQLLPEFGVAYHLRGSCYLHLGDYAKALGDFTRASDAEPRNTELHRICAAVHDKLGHDAEARKLRDRAVVIDPKLKNAPDLPLPVPIPPVKKDPELSDSESAESAAKRKQLANLLASGRQALAKGGRIADLEAISREALAIDPESPGALALRGTFRAVVQKDSVGAMKDAEAALKLNPETFRALYLRGHLLDEKGNYAEAVADFTEAIRLEPSDPLPWVRRAKAYGGLHEYHQAIADANQALERQPVREAYTNRGMAYAMLGGYDKAIADYNEAEKLAPDNARVFVLRAEIYAKMGKREQSDADWATAKSLDRNLRDEQRRRLADPVKPPTRKKLSAEESKKLEQALAEFERAWFVADLERCRKTANEACDIDPTSAAARSARSRIHAQDGRHKDALADANEAIRFDPRNAWAYSNRAAARIGLGEAAAGIADATISLTLDSTNPLPWNTRSWGYIERGRYHQAIFDANEALLLRPRFELPYVNRAACNVHLGEYQKALADYASALEITPTNAEWEMICASIHKQLGNADEALNHRLRAARIDPKLKDVVAVPLPPRLPPAKKDPEFNAPAEPVANTSVDEKRAQLARFLARGLQLIEETRLEELGTIAAQALQIDPQSPTALALRATYRLAVQKDQIGARQDVDAALRFNPETRQALLIKAVIDDDETKHADAIAATSIVIRLDPTHPAGWANRSYSYLQLKEYHQALHDANQAIARKLELGDGLLNRGAAFASLGEYQKAMADFDAAEAMCRRLNDPGALIHRSALHEKMGNNEKAKADWEAAKKMSPDLQPADRLEFPDPPKPIERKKLTPEQIAKFEGDLKAAHDALAKRKYAEARILVDEALRIDSTSAKAHVLSARLFMLANVADKAETEAAEAIRLDPKEPWAYIVRGGVKGRKDDNAGAIADNTIAITLDPSIASGWINRGFGYMSRGQFHQALHDYDEAVRRGSDHAQAFVNRGSCLLRFGQYERALADYLEAEKLQPNNPQIPRVLASICAQLGKDEQAAKHRERAVILDNKLVGAPDLPLPKPLSVVKKDPVLVEPMR